VTTAGLVAVTLVLQHHLMSQVTDVYTLSASSPTLTQTLTSTDLTYQHYNHRHSFDQQAVMTNLQDQSYPQQLLLP